MLAIVAVVLNVYTGYAADLPDDPFRRCATKIVMGMMGEIDAWKLKAYQLGLKMGVKTDKLLILTQYNALEGKSGRIDCSGRKLGPWAAASNKLPQGTIIWANPTGLRFVCDRGAKFNDRRAARIGGVWVDIWFPNARTAVEAGIDGWVPAKAAVIPNSGIDPRINLR